MDTIPYDAVYAALPYGLCVVDGEGRILSVNPALEQLLGWRSPEWRGQTLSLRLKQTISDLAQALCWTVALSQALDQGQTTHLNLPTDFRTGFDDAHLVSVTGVVAPWQGSSAERAGALVVFQDSTLQRDLTGMRTRFLSVLSHELGTPVTNLTAAADQLTMYLDADDAKSRSLLQVIRAEANRLKRLLAQFPTTLPARAGIPRPRKRLITLRPLLRQAAQAFGVRDLDCQIVVQTPPDLSFVWSDADSINEILSKLVASAIRLAPPGTQIVLAAEEREDHVIVSVSDRGPGVPEGDGDTIFGHWCRGSQEEPAAEHQGLGLSMARSLVQALDGRLWYERRPEGRTCFCFALPRAEGLPDEEGEGETDHGGHYPGR
jgi:K+-sensing histidine kinase KdpD